MRHKRSQPVRARLVRQKHRMELELDRLRATMSARDVAGPEDEADRAMENLEFHVRTAAAEAMQQEIRQISEAIQKMSLGTYGQCEACERPIGRTRLKALPYASLCLSCKAEQERLMKAAASRAARFPIPEFPADGSDLVPALEKKIHDEIYEASELAAEEE